MTVENRVISVNIVKINTWSEYERTLRVLNSSIPNEHECTHTEGEYSIYNSEESYHKSVTGIKLAVAHFSFEAQVKVFAVYENTTDKNKI